MDLRPQWLLELGPNTPSTIQRRRGAGIKKMGHWYRTASPPLEKCWRGIGLFEHRTIRDASGNFGHTGSLAPCPHQVEVSSVSAKQYVWVARGRHKNFLSTIHGGSPLSAPFWGRVISRKTLNSWNAREAGRPHRSHIPVKN